MPIAARRQDKKKERAPAVSQSRHDLTHRVVSLMPDGRNIPCEIRKRTRLEINVCFGKMSDEFTQRLDGHKAKDPFAYVSPFLRLSSWISARSNSRSRFQGGNRVTSAMRLDLDLVGKIPTPKDFDQTSPRIGDKESCCGHHSFTQRRVFFRYHRLSNAPGDPDNLHTVAEKRL